MKLYIVNGSNNARKCQSVCSHLGLSPEIVRLDFFNGDLQKSDFLKINPNGKVPVLVDGERTLWESEAINIYLCTTKVVDHPLFAPKLRADILRWMFWSIAHYNNNLGGVVWEAVAKPHFLKQEGTPEVLARHTELFHQFAKVLNAHLDGRQYMVGDDWTLADYSIGHIESFVEHVPIDLKQYKNVYAFYDRLRANPHWQSSAVPMDMIGRSA